MRAGILSVARKALDGCSLMNTLGSTSGSRLGICHRGGKGGEKRRFFFFRKLKRNRFKRTSSHLPTSNFQGIFVSFQGGQFFLQPWVVSWRFVMREIIKWWKLWYQQKGPKKIQVVERISNFIQGPGQNHFPWNLGKIFICQFVSGFWASKHTWHRHHHTSTYLNTFAMEIDRRWRFLGAPHKIPWVKLIVHSYSRHGGCACCLAEKENHCPERVYVNEKRRVVAQIPSGGLIFEWWNSSRFLVQFGCRKW